MQYSERRGSAPVERAPVSGLHSSRMPLTIGARVGAYDVVSPLGAGGMGEVFRARDARLKRDVALKVLPIAAVADADRRARFEREAQVLAALDHPNIAKVFGVEDADGSPVIVMELVEGPTLAERLAGRPMPFDEALAVALDLCHGLAAAHDAGVVHRDLKPANIKVRPDGVVKILDFGLALAPASDGPDTANSPTVLNMRTMPGAILGTAAYMSPEQARGRPVDARADVWAFGCVLYEMLTGRPAFSGETTTDILAAVVHTEPDWSALPATLPPRVEELLQRCLQKAVKDRQRDLGDAGFQLQRARSASSDGRPASPPAKGRAPSAANPSAPPTSERGERAWLRPAVAFAVGAAAVALWLGLGGATPAPAPASATPVRTSVVLPEGLTLSLGRGSSVAISPSGTRVVFAGRDGATTALYRRDLERFESQLLAGTDGASEPFFSPDGRWVGFVADRLLKKVSMDGGAPVNIAPAPILRGNAWGDNDTVLFTPTNGAPVMRVSANGGEPAGVTVLAKGEASHRWPRVLPGATGVLFSVWNDTGWEPASIHAQRLDGTGRTAVVARNGGYPRYLRDGDAAHGFLVYARENGLMAIRFDEATLTTTGTATPVFDGLITNLSGGAHFDLSPGGTLAYVPGASDEANRDLQWVALDGSPSPPIEVRNFSSRGWDLSPDGRRVVFSNTTGGPTRNLWVVDLEGATTSQLTQGTDSFAPVWSGDGASIFYLKGNSDPALVRRALRPGATDEIVSAEGGRGVNNVSRDGRWMLRVRNNPDTGADIVAEPLTPLAAGGTSSAPTAGAPRPIVATPASETDPNFSPDGRWLVYQSNASGRLEIHARAFHDGDREYTLSTAGGTVPRWAPSGREVFFRAPDNAMMAVSVTASETTLTVDAPRRLFDAARYDGAYAVGPDGRQLLMMPALTTETAATEIRFVFNFLDELRARVK